MNNYYQSKPAHNQHYKYPLVPQTEPGVKPRPDRSSIPHLSQFNTNEYWCDEIILNTDRYCGPYFLKSKLNTLPKRFGPGPIVFVLLKLLQSLISVSEKPFKLLKLLQASRRNLATNTNSFSLTTQRAKLMQRLRLKAKEKGKYLYRELEVCTKQAQLDAYLSELCAKLKCCSDMLLKSSELSSNNGLG